MSIGTSLGTAALHRASARLTAAGGLASSLIGSSAAKTAASDQEQASQSAIDEQQREFDTQQANYAPWLAAGTRRAFATDRGHRARRLARRALQRDVSGARAVHRADRRRRIERSRLCVPARAGQIRRSSAPRRPAAARSRAGRSRRFRATGRTTRRTSTQNVYNRALTGYNTNVNTGLNSFLTNFNAYNTGQGNTFNRLASLAGMGQTATGQLGQLGQANASTHREPADRPGQRRGGGHARQRERDQFGFELA